MFKNFKSRKIVIAITALFAAYFYNENRGFVSPIVKIDSGQIQGFAGVSRDNREYFKYLGIPYAKPPLGALRFEPPQLPDKWDGVRYAGKFGNVCVQVTFLTYSYIGSEDCLTLNVYVPKNRHSEDVKLLPVVVWFYGGLYMEGMTNIYGAEYFMDEDVVLVTVNYRIGVLGFLNTNDHVVRGNMGLKDQTFALKWIQRNIEGFGGNPGQVTIAGQSAGGASVHYHMLSPMSKGLFHKAISFSGVAINPWALNKYPHEQAVRFARRFCPVGNSSEMVTCLKMLPISSIYDAQLEYVDLLRDVLAVFVPTVEAVKDDSAFLTEYPLDIIKNGSFNKVPWILGATSHEGLMFTALTLNNASLLQAAIEDWSFLLPRVMYLKPDMITTLKIKEYYFGNATTITYLTPEQLQNFTDFFSDRHFYKGIQDAANLHSKHHPVHLYYMSHVHKFSVVNFIMSRGEMFHPAIDIGIHVIKRWIQEKLFGLTFRNNGTSHIDDLSLIFDLGIPLQVEDEGDNEMSRRTIKMVTSFASNSSGTPLEFGGVRWPLLNSAKEDSRPVKHFELSLNPKIIDEPFRERVQFWNSLEVPYP